MSTRFDKFGMSAELWALVILAGIVLACLAFGGTAVWLVAKWAGVL